MRQVHFYESLKDFRDLFIGEDEIDALVTAGIFETDGKTSDDERGKSAERLLSQARTLRAEIDQCVKTSVDRGIQLPLVRIREIFGLQDVELHALVISMAPLLDSRYEKLYSYLQNDFTKKSISIDLVVGLLDLDFDNRLDLLASFDPAARLRHYHLIENTENGSERSMAQIALHADPRIVHYALGHGTIDQRVLQYMRMFAQSGWEDVVIDQSLRSRLKQLFELSVSKEAGSVYYFYGRSGVGKKSTAWALCGEAELPLAVVDVRSVLQNQESFRENVRLILREGLLQPCAVCFDHFERLETLEEDHPTLLGHFIEEVSGLGWIVFLCGENPLPARLLDLPTICPVEIPPPDRGLQDALWRSHLGEGWADKESFDPALITSRFDLTGDQIVRACRKVKQSAHVRNPGGAQFDLSDLYESCRSLSQPRLGTLARKIKPKYRWGDLVLPADQTSHLKELCSQVMNRHVVMGEWGFNAKLSLGRGIAALFTGQSGTGKTMAAEVIANDLSLDLFKIDLSAVVSKYIGETEKNLSRIFAEAEHSSAILFFDEADALLGKRSEVKDAHDRYANIEIAYLLQKLEEYEGVTILATNLRQNIDEAFTRRIRFIVDFPFPNEDYRLRIWQGIWPRATPLAVDADLAFMARQFEMTGGNIRNTALAAAFFAANDGGVVNMKHLMLATKRELQKMGKLSVKEDFGDYKDLV